MIKLPETLTQNPLFSRLFNDKYCSGKINLVDQQYHDKMFISVDCHQISVFFTSVY